MTSEMKNETSKIKIVLVEDEAILAQDITLKLNKFNYQVTNTVQSADEAINVLTQNSDIQLIIIDIKIKGDKDGIELAQFINANYDIPFIFLTSHADEESVQRAKLTNPSAYLLKPFNERQIGIAIELALTNFSLKFKSTDNSAKKQNEDVNEILKIKDSLFLKKNNHFERVLIDEIQYIEAESNYTTIYTKSDKYLYSMVLKKLEKELPTTKFLRVHRSYIVNISSVLGFQGNMLFLKDKKIPVSKSNHDIVFKLFKTI